jgi:hypothetical protein
MPVAPFWRRRSADRSYKRRRSRVAPWCNPPDVIGRKCSACGGRGHSGFAGCDQPLVGSAARPTPLLRADTLSSASCKRAMGFLALVMAPAAVRALVAIRARLAPAVADLNREQALMAVRTLIGVVAVVQARGIAVGTVGVVPDKVSVVEVVAGG